MAPDRLRRLVDAPVVQRYAARGALPGSWACMRVGWGRVGGGVAGVAGLQTDALLC